MSASSDPKLSVSRASGPMFCGSLVSSILVGVVLNQGAMYFLRHRRDPILYKAAVGTLMFLSIFAWAGYFKILFTLLIADPSEAVFTSTPDDGRPMVMLAPAVANFIAQCFFGRRAYLLSNRRRLVGYPIAVMSILTLICGLTAFVLSIIDNHWTTDVNGDPTVPITWEYFSAGTLVLATLTDIMISSVLGVILWPKRHGFNERTDSLIAKILLMAVTTSGITSIVACIDLGLIIAQIIRPSIGNAEDGVSSNLTPISSLMVIGTLNLRSYLQHGSSDFIVTSPMNTAGSQIRPPRAHPAPAKSTASTASPVKGASLSSFSDSIPFQNLHSVDVVLLNQPVPKSRQACQEFMAR